MPVPASPQTVPRSRYGGLAVLLPLAVTAIVQYRITRGCFRSDDFLNLYQIANYPLWQYLIIPNAGHLLLTRNAVFYVSSLLFGAHAWPYLWTALLTHLVNVGLLYAVIVRFTGSRSAAVCLASLWGACALHVESVGYYAVYGHLLVGGALLLILLTADRDGEADGEPRPLLIAVWYGLALGAATCFGTGIAMAMTLPLVLALLLPRWRPAWRLRLPLVSLLAVVPVLYVVLHKIYQLAFDIGPVHDRLHIVARSAVSLPFAMVRMLAFALFRLLLGPLPAEWVFPAGYALLIAAGAALAWFAWQAPPTTRRRLAACLLLLLSCYGIVVLARVFRVYDAPARIMNSDGRLHYAPMIPLAILLAFLWQPLSARLPRLAGVAAAALALILALPAIGPIEADNRCAGTQRIMKKALMRIAVTLRMAPPDQRDIVIRNGPFAPAPMPVVFPGWAGLFAIYYPSNEVDGRRVVFIERNPQVIDWAQRGRRSRTLLIPPPPDVPSMEVDLDMSPAQPQPMISLMPVDDVVTASR